jgi:tungstate transport system permease protein
VSLIWNLLKDAVPLIVHGNPTLFGVISFTLQVAVVSTAIAALIGIPLGLAIGLHRGRGRRVWQLLANASLGLPPALVGAALFLVSAPRAPLGSLQLIDTRRVVFVAQTILALPYTTALTAAAVQGLPPGLLEQARLLGAGRRQVALLGLREARIGVMAAIIAALGSTLSEVAAIAIVGGNIYGYNQTLASATLYEVNGANYADALAIGIVLLIFILVLMCALGVLQQRVGIRLRFRPAT